MAGRSRCPVPQPFPPLRLAFLLTLLLAACACLPRVTMNPWLAGSFWGAIGVLLLFQLLLRWHVVRHKRVLSYKFVAAPVHYVQPALQLCIYTYWGWYWPELPQAIVLIVAQLVFLYALDMLVCWTRRDTWIFGFGPFPIVLSTNLFLWFKDDWFFLQFLLVAIGVLGKEFIKWTRDGRRTHIFNPSALALFLFSIVLIATNYTDISWGEQIASTFGRPPHIYLAIFLVGLVVQSLFSVTLVTLAAAATLYGLNLMYLHVTGVFPFVDINIPAPVFLGLHLLVTDPATSPRTAVGKVVFGAMYSVMVFALYPILGWLGAPRFYDKLLCVPLLNLSVRALDRMGNALAGWFHPLETRLRWSARQYNLAHMAVWVALFVTMLSTGFLSKPHPGSNPAFWQQACEDGRFNGCQTWIGSLDRACNRGSAADCTTLGRVFLEGRLVARAPLQAGMLFGQACDLGWREGCASLREFVRVEGLEVFLQGCNNGVGALCFLLGSLYQYGLGVPKDLPQAVTLFRQSCDYAFPRGCGRLGSNYFRGEGVAVDHPKARENFEQACRGGHAPSCYNIASMYRRGLGGRQEEALARQRLQQACDLGLPSACPGGVMGASVR
jgi:hypothetical protein